MIILSTLGVIRQQVELAFQHESDLQDTRLGQEVFC